jgi:hypothetical protein
MTFDQGLDRKDFSSAAMRFAASRCVSCVMFVHGVRSVDVAVAATVKMLKHSSCALNHQHIS